MSNLFPSQSVILTCEDRTVQVTRVQEDTKRIRLDFTETPEESHQGRITFQVYPVSSSDAAERIVAWLGPLDPAVIQWAGLAVCEGYGDYRETGTNESMISAMRLGGYSLD